MIKITAKFRNYLALLCLTFYMQISFAQSDSSIQKNQSIQYGLRPTTYLTAYSSEYNFGLYLTLLKGKHELAIGPSVGEMPYFYFPFFLYSNSNGRKIAGVDLSYRIYPNGQGKIFNFYFQLNSMQKWGKNTAPVSINGVNEMNTVNGFSTELLVEQGFDIKFLNYFYIDSSIGFGGLYSKRKFETVVSPQTVNTFEDVDFNFILRASLGVRF